MKKIFYCLLIIATSNLYSQLFNPFIQLGLQSSQIDGDRFGGYYKPGTKLGGGISILDDKLNYSIAMYYSREGSRSSATITPYLVDYTENYIDLSIGTGYKFYPDFSIYGGIQIGYLISAKTNSAGSITDFDKELKKIDIPYEIGIGYDINEKWEVMIKQSRSLPTIRKNNYPFRNNNLGIFFNYKF